MEFQTTVTTKVVAELDEKKSTENIGVGVENINRNGKTPKVKVEIDAESIRQQGLKVIKATEDVEKQIRRMFKPINGEIDVKSITNANNQIDQYNIAITERNQIIDQYILKLREVKELDGTTYPAFVQTRLTSNDKGNGSLLVKQTKELAKAKAEIENLMNQFLAGNGNKILGKDSRVDDILNKLVEAENLVNKLSATAGRNPRDKMEDVTTFINKIKTQANDYHEIEEAEKKAAKQREADNQKAIKDTEEQTAALKKYKAEVNDLLDTYIRVNGTKLLTKDKNSSDIQNRSVDLLGDINKLSKTAGLNTPEQMEYIKDTIGLLKKEADEYYRIEKNQKSLIDSQTKEVEVVQNKVTSLSNRYIDKSGSNQLFDTKNIEDVNTQISKIMSKVSELRANTGRSSYNFEANLSVLNNMYDALEKNAKGYYKLETEQKKSSELYQKQAKDLSLINEEIKKIENTALNNKNGKGLIDESNINKAKTELEEIKSIYDVIYKGHNNKEIIQTEAFDLLEIKLKNIKNNISSMTDEERLTQSVSKGVESQLDALNRYDQRVKDIFANYSKNGRNQLVDPSHVERFNKLLNNTITEISRLQQKAGSVTEEEARNLSNMVSSLNRIAQGYSNVEKEQQKNESNLQKQKKDLNDIWNQLQGISRTTLNPKASGVLGDPEHLRSVRKDYGELTETIYKLQKQNESGKVIDVDTMQKARDMLAKLNQDITVFKQEETLIKNATKSMESQLNTLNSFEQKTKNLRFGYLSKEGSNQLFNLGNINDLESKISSLEGRINSMRNTIATNNEATYRELVNEYNAVSRLAQGYANIEKNQSKSDRDTQSQLNKFITYSETLKKIRENYLTSTSPTKLMDTDHITDIKDRIGELELKLSNFKATAGTVTDEQIRDYQELSGELQRLAQRYANIEKAESSEEKTLLSQKYAVEDYIRTLRKIQETTLNPQSTQALTDKENIDKVSNSYKILDNIIVGLKTDSDNLQIIPQYRMDEAKSMIKDLVQDIDILRREEHALLNANTSQEKLYQDVSLQAEKLKTFIQLLQNSGLYVGQFKAELEAMQESLANVSTPRDLETFKNQFANIAERAKQASVEIQNSFAVEDLQAKIRIFSAQVTGYMQQNTRATKMFASQFEAIRSGIKSVSDKNDLAKLQNDFKLLQQNINNAGKAGQTFGERMSAAVKKFMMWTGMTNVVMYLVRSIRQMINHTKELDSAMVSLKKVTDETNATYARMFDNATEKAKDLNTSIKNIINSTAEFAKLGFSTEQAQELAEVANVYANVGEMDIQDATESLVSTINGFKDLSADDAWKIIDEFNNVGKQIAHSL